MVMPAFRGQVQGHYIRAEIGRATAPSLGVR
jgi:hypothetical protein